MHVRPRSCTSRAWRPVGPLSAARRRSKDGTAVAEMPVGSVGVADRRDPVASRRGDPARARRDAQGGALTARASSRTSSASRAFAPAPAPSGAAEREARASIRATRPLRVLAQQLVVALEERLTHVQGRRARRCSRARRAHCDAGSAHRCAGRTGARSAAVSDAPSSSSQSDERTWGSRAGGQRVVRAPFLEPRFQGQTSWQMSQP